MTVRAFRYTILLICLIAAFPANAHAQLMAGAARASVTPDPAKVKYPLGGYVSPNRLQNNATGILDTCYSRALALSNGGKRVVIVATDLCFLPANVHTAVMEQLAGSGLMPENVFISATHTHSALDPMTIHSGNTGTVGALPKFRKELLDFIADGIATSIKQAVANQRAARMGVIQQGGIGLNRPRNAQKTTDDEMTLLRVDGTDGKPIAALVNYAAHPVYFGDENLMVSGDWSGAMERQLEAKLPGAVALFMNGAEGDASPNGSDEGSNGEKILVYAAKIGEKVMGLYQQCKLEEDATLASWRQEVKLPARQPHPLFLLISIALRATQDQAKDLVNRTMPETTSISFARVGNLLLIGFPGEPTAPVGLSAKAMAREAGVPNAAVVALTNGWLGYLLMPEQYRMGKYEATMSFYGEQIGTTLLEGVKAGLSRFKDTGK